MKRVIRVFLVLFFLILSTAPLHKTAGEDCNDTAKIFSSTYDISYSFDLNGKAKITQKIILKNLVGACFASEYALKINSTNLQDISGQDSIGNLYIKVNKDKESTTLTAKLNDEVIGKNKTVAFQLTYTLEGLAKKQSLIWDITIPRVLTSEKVTNYNLQLVTPSSFGKVFSIAVQPDLVNYGKDQTDIRFKSKEILERAVSVSFGDFQEISFKVRIPLENHSLFKRSFDFYLPPDTEKQKVLLKKLEPMPGILKMDQMGNYVVQYKVSGNSLVEIYIEGTIKIIGAGGQFVPPKPISNQELTNLKEAAPFIEVQDSLVQEKAKDLKGVREIYNFVVSYLDYDKKGVETGKADRKGAASLLRKKKLATNLDFADLFVAVARAAGLPTREVIGFPLSETSQLKPVFVGSHLNSNRVHVWVQVYDTNKRKWINIDPTWGKTSGVDYIQEDLSDRFILLITNSGDLTGDIANLQSLIKNFEITTDNKKENFVANPLLDIQVDQVFAGFPAEITIKVVNNSGVSLTGGKISIASENANIMGKNEINVPVIFPYETKVFKAKLRGGSLFGTISGNLNVKLKLHNGTDTIKKEKTDKILVRSFFSLGQQQILLFLITVLLLVGVFFPKINKYFGK